MKRSNNKYDVFKWIEKVILSCKTIRQDFNAEELIYIFDKKYKDSDLTQELFRISFRNSTNLVP